jgi:hypothetical protein
MLSCTSKKEIYNADLETYLDYLTYIKALSSGKRAIGVIKTNNPDTEFLVKDFPKINTDVLMFYNKTLNVDYIIFYSNWVEKNLVKFMNAKAENMYNSEAINITAAVQKFVISNVREDSRKVFIGFEAGGMIATILADGFQDIKNIEVITFGTPAFTTGFKQDFKMTNITLESDNVIKIKARCCLEHKIQNIAFYSNKSTKGLIKIEAYQDGIQKHLNALKTEKGISNFNDLD